VVTRIPRGSTNLDIRQYAPDDNKDDDIYLGKFLILADRYRATGILSLVLSL